MSRPTDRVWFGSAACRDADPELFFPIAASGAVYAAQVAAAKRVCASCLVRAECLEFAVRALPDGIAGGMTPAERRDAARRTGRPQPVELVGGTRTEVANAGRAAIAAGGTPVEVAERFGVSVRTANRWAAEVRAASARSRKSRRGVA